MANVVSIHQSQFLPWIPYFAKILSSDVFVVLDDVQFQKNGVQNRNMIKTPQGAQWLTIPVKQNLEQRINQVMVPNIESVKAKTLKTLEMNYKKTPYFERVFVMIENAFAQCGDLLFGINHTLTLGILNLIGGKLPQIVLSSTIATHGKKQDLVLELLNATDATVYITGGGKYCEIEKFGDLKVKHLYFTYEQYSQSWNKRGFVSDLSVVDLLFNNLTNAREYINRNTRLGDMN